MCVGIVYLLACVHEAPEPQESSVFVIDTAPRLALSLKNTHLNGMNYSMNQSYIIFNKNFAKLYPIAGK